MKQNLWLVTSNKFYSCNVFKFRPLQMRQKTFTCRKINPLIRVIDIYRYDIKRKVVKTLYKEIPFQHDLDEFDTINLPGYVFYSKPRKDTGSRKSGGLGLFVKSSISPHIDEINSLSDYLLTVKLSKTFFSLNQDVFICIVYVPPEGSKYHDTAKLYCLEDDISNFCQNNKYVILAGDWNARIGNMKDYFNHDNFIMSQVDIPSYEMNADIFKTLETHNIQLNRVSQDKKTIALGFTLLDICKNNDLFVLNGQFQFQFRTCYLFTSCFCCFFCFFLFFFFFCCCFCFFCFFFFFFFFFFHWSVSLVSPIF